jgi:uncharacterized protein
VNRPVHFEIFTEHPVEMARFYDEVFGWKAATWEGPQTYWVVTTGPRETPGIDGGFTHRHFEQRVINTVAVSSIEEWLGKVEKAGGKKIHGPSEIPGIGLHAYCADPDGNLFGILEPKCP